MSYNNVLTTFKNLSLENAIIGEIASCQNTLLQTEYRILNGNSLMDEFLF